MPDIIILGVFVADAAYRTERMPVTGQSLLGTGFQLGPGGKVSNQTVAAAKAGGDVGFISRIGNDTFGQMDVTFWAEAAVEALVIEDQDRPTGSAGIFIEEATGRNAIVIAPGAAGAISVTDVEGRTAEIAASKVAMTQLEQPIEAALRFLEIAAQAGVTTVLNPAPAAELPGGMPALCDYVTPNETEAEELTGCRVTGPDDALEAAKALLAQGVRKGALITLGEQGSLFWDGARAIHSPPMNAGPAVDTTGAGDAFNGGFATALAEGQAVEDALKFATACAALSVTKHGTSASMPSRADIETLL